MVYLDTAYKHNDIAIFIETTEIQLNSCHNLLNLLNYNRFSYYLCSLLFFLEAFVGYLPQNFLCLVSHYIASYTHKNHTTLSLCCTHLFP